MGGVLRERPDQRNTLAALLQRQHVAVVLQQDDGAARAVARQRVVRRNVRLVRLARGVQAAVGIVEQARRRLHVQHAAHRLVDLGHRQPALLHQRGHVVGVHAALQAHVQAGRQGLLRRIGLIGGIAVGDQFQVGRVVGDDEALELPLAAQDVGQQFAVGGRGHAVDVVERTHQRQCAGIQGGLERRQVHVAQGLRRHVHEVVVQAGGNRAIGGEVLGRGQQRIGRGQVLALEAAHAGGGELAGQVHVLAGGFGHAAPALVARDIHHRRERPVDAGRSRFLRGRPRGAFGQVGFETGGFAQRDREHRAHAVDHVGPQQQRDAQAALLHRDALRLAALGRAHTVEQRTDTAAADLLAHLLGIAGEGLRVDLEGERPQRIGKGAELTDLFLQRHGGDQALDPSLMRHVGDPPGNAGVTETAL